MRCWQCGAPVRESAKICMYCGAALSQDDTPDRDAQAPRPIDPPASRRSSSPSIRPRAGADDSVDYDPRGSSFRDERLPRSRSGSQPERQPGGQRFANPFDDPRTPSSLRQRGEDRGQPRTPSPRGADRDHGTPRQGPERDADRYDSREYRPDSRAGYGARGAYDETGDLDPSGYWNTPDVPPSRYDQPRRDASAWGYTDEQSAYLPAPPRDRYSERSPHQRQSQRDPWEDEPAYGHRGWDESQEYSAEFQAQRGWDDLDSREGPAYADDSREYWAARQPGALTPQERQLAPRRAAAPASARGGTRIPPDRAKTRKRKRSPLVVLFVLLALVVIAGGIVEGPALLNKVRGQAQAGGVSAAPTYTPGPTPTVIPQFKNYVSPHSQYAMNYPQSWNVTSSTENSSGYDYLDTYQQQSPYAIVRVERAAGFDSSTDADIIKSEVAGGEQSHQSFTETPGTSTSTVIGGQSWMRQEYDVTAGTQHLHMVILACHHNGKGFALVLATGIQDYDSVNKADFAFMLQSFRFTS